MLSGTASASDTFSHQELYYYIESDNTGLYRNYILNQAFPDEMIIKSLPLVISLKLINILNYLLSKDFVIKEIESKMKKENSYVLLAVETQDKKIIEAMLCKNKILRSFIDSINKHNAKRLVDFFYDSDLWYFFSDLFDSKFLFKNYIKNTLIRIARDRSKRCISIFLSKESIKSYLSGYYVSNLKIDIIKSAIDAQQNDEFFEAILSSEIFNHVILKQNFLAYAVTKENESAIKFFLNIKSVFQKEINNKNSALVLAVKLGKTKSVIELLKNEHILSNEIENLYGILTAIYKKDIEMLDLFLKTHLIACYLKTIPLLSAAIESEDSDIILRFLKIKDFRTIFENNKAMIKKLLGSKNIAAIQYFLKTSDVEKIKKDHWLSLLFLDSSEIILGLLKSKKIINWLDLNPDLVLSLFEKSSRPNRIIFSKKLCFYGVPLSFIVSRNGYRFKDLKVFFKNPDKYMYAMHLDDSQFLAYKLLKGKWEIHEKIMTEKTKEKRVAFQDEIENSFVIKKVKKYFDTVIEPELRSDFIRYGENDLKRLEAIEHLIRKDILNKIKKNSIDRIESPEIDEVLKKKDRDIINYMSSLSGQKEDDLCNGNNCHLMDEARNYFNSNNDMEVAWRAYDQFAPVGRWPNLLTKKTNRFDRVWARNMSGNFDSTMNIADASKMARTFWSYTYLLINKSTTETERLHCLDMFIVQLSEVRRANSDNNKSIDSPSCLPDTCTRAGAVMQLCPLGFGLRDPLEFASELISSVVVQGFQKLLESYTTIEEKKNAYYALMVLNEQTAVEILSGDFKWQPIDGEGDYCYFTKEILSIRALFIEKIWNKGALLQAINQEMIAKGLKKIDKKDIFGFLNNIGGSWVSERLGTIYKQHMSDFMPLELEMIDKPIVLNPYRLAEHVKIKMSQWRQAVNQCLYQIWEISLKQLKVLESELPEEIIAEQASSIADLYMNEDFIVEPEHLQSVLFAYNIRDAERVQILKQELNKEASRLFLERQRLIIA